MADSCVWVSRNTFVRIQYENSTKRCGFVEGAKYGYCRSISCNYLLRFDFVTLAWPKAASTSKICIYLITIILLYPFELVD